MEKKTYYCDRCGKEMTGIKRQLAVRWGDEGNDNRYLWETEYGADLCEECYEIVDDAIAKAVISVAKEPAPVEDPEEKQPEPDGRKSKTIKLDLGKVKALREAGWSQAKIADEMGVSVPTIGKALAKIYDKEGEA